MFPLISLRVEYPASIIVAELREWSCCAQGEEDLEHSLECPVELGRDACSVSSREDPGMQEKVQRVGVVVKRLFEMHSIRPDLALSLAQHDAPAEVFPAPRGLRT